ncbi:MAG: branched-chain amino acid ABC transporter permease [Acetobacteraceae bacterium]|nr:branched-chain amino acid ABC transporter permease [Acetobacteraceae bacterium]
MRPMQVAGAAVLLVLVLAYPALVNAYWLTVGILAIFYAIVTASWTLLVGYAGQLSFGHVGFVSMGAYCSALLVADFGLPIPLGMAAGLVLAGVAGAMVGYTCLRMHGPYLAIFTMAFSEVFRIIALTENEVTGGAGGLEVTPLFHTRSDAPYFYLGLALLAGSLGLMSWMTSSCWGLFFRAIRENEQAAAAAGVKVVRFRVLVFAIASSFAGLAGAFYAHFIGILTPDIGSIDQMGGVVAAAVIGGAESLPAAVVGAAFIEFLFEALRAYGEWRLVIFGALLLLTVRFARNGLFTLAWNSALKLAPVRRPQPAE